MTWFNNLSLRAKICWLRAFIVHTKLWFGLTVRPVKYCSLSVYPAPLFRISNQIDFSTQIAVFFNTFSWAKVFKLETCINLLLSCNLTLLVRRGGKI
jgi:hypothetical protein